MVYNNSKYFKFQIFETQYDNDSAYWANTSSNELVSELIRKAGNNIKENFKELMSRKTIRLQIDEQLIYSQLEEDETAIWSLLVASGYLKIVSYKEYNDFDYEEEIVYELAITNREVRRMFRSMASGCFNKAREPYNNFIKAMLINDLDAMNVYMNRVSIQTFSSFDTGNCPSKSEPERFCYGFVLGLMADLSTEYIITSNCESGFG